MGLPVFWCPSLAGDLLRLDGTEGHHAAVVRRLAVGERVRLTDGAGGVVDGAVTAVGKRTVDVAVELRTSRPPPKPRLTVVQAVPKGERAELAVQALTEVGVDRVVPWSAGRSQVRMTGERSERLLSRWRSWAREASKQSRRAWFCEIADVASTADVARLLGGSACGLVLHESAAEPLSVPGDVTDVVLVVGPEGGITDEELATLLHPPAPTRPGPPTRPDPPTRPGPPTRPDPPSGARTSAADPETGHLAPLGGPGGVGVTPVVRAVRLGDTVLRTSTAGAVAAGVVLAATRWR